MLEAFLLAETSATAVLTTVYWTCLVVGGGLVLLSLLGGEGADTDVEISADADFDVDFAADGALDAEVDGAADVADAADAHGYADATALSSWFSMRFFVFFLAVFGVVGVVFRYVASFGTWLTFGSALIAGLLGGQCVHQIFRAIRRTSGDSTPRPQDYINKLARVTIAITHPDKGEVAVQVRSARRFVPAVGIGSPRSFDSGDEVVVVGYRAGVAQVISREEFERKARST